MHNLFKLSIYVKTYRSILTFKISMSSFVLKSVKMPYALVNLLFSLVKLRIKGFHVQADNDGPFIRKSDPNLVHMPPKNGKVNFVSDYFTRYICTLAFHLLKRILRQSTTDSSDCNRLSNVEAQRAANRNFL